MAENPVRTKPQDGSLFQGPSKPIVHAPFCTKGDVVNDCKCGQNRYCRTCGWGAGQIPCACRPAPKIGNSRG